MFNKCVLSLSPNGFRPTSLFVIEAMFAVFLFPMRLCEVSACFRVIWWLQLHKFMFHYFHNIHSHRLESSPGADPAAGSAPGLHNYADHVFLEIGYAHLIRCSRSLGLQCFVYEHLHAPILKMGLMGTVVCESAHALTHSTHTHRRSQDFCLRGTRPTPPSHASAAHTFEAVASSCGSVSAPAVNRVMGGAPQRKTYMWNDIWGCCKPQIHWYDIHKCRWNVLHSDEHTQWTVQWCSSAQVAASFGCSFKSFYIYQAFLLLFHKSLHPPSLCLSLSVPLSLFSFCGTLSGFLISGLSLRFGFLLAIQSSLQLEIFTIQWTHPVTISTLMLSCHLVTIAARRQYCHLVVITASIQWRHLAIMTASI